MTSAHGRMVFVNLDVGYLVVITKIDQVDAIGSLLGVLAEMGIPISYLSAGQGVPDDIEPGTYRLQLTMEDAHGKKYGQANVPFEIAK